MIGWAVLALLLIGATAVVVGVVCGAVAGGRALYRFLFPPPRVRLVRVVPAPLRFVWLVCHTPLCGHLQTEHYPAGPGRVACNGCGTVRPRP
ncbi:hypothetical protein ACFU8I_41500 [Streptomyces sp. NPDC057540]|uniref:hypothetical protein n=1 Tax=Streptomyces sp. NPDC057540 TaxID=3346160 RepID=UPI003691DA72